MDEYTTKLHVHQTNFSVDTLHHEEVLEAIILLTIRENGHRLCGGGRFRHTLIELLLGRLGPIVGSD